MAPRVAALLLALAAASVQAADETPSGGELQLALRYRFEHVEQDGFSRDADASTLRGRLTYRSAAARGFSGLAEFDAVAVVLTDNYNSGSGTSSARRNVYPVVADPDYAEINQLYLQFDGVPQTRLRLGRQRILLDNQRFVGGVGWRQNEQTFDGFSIRTDALADTTVFYSYIANVNRIFGDDVPAGDHDSDTHLFNAAYAFDDSTRLAAYLYSIDNDDVPALSTTTFGLRFTGQSKLAGGKLACTLEAARQHDAASNPSDFSAGYYRIDGKLSHDAVSLLAGYEVLGGSASPGKAFRTPLATLHAFNGWADQFLATPDDGLQDLWLGLGATAGAWSLEGVFHDFSAESGSRDFGTEIDFSAGRKLGDRYSLLLKLARFRADNPAFRDTTKIWVMGSADY